MNERVAGTTGIAYSEQLQQLYVQMLQLYQLFSTYIADGSAGRLGHSREMRTVKRDTLRIVTTYLEKY